MAIASIPRLLHQARIAGASALAFVGGFIATAGLYVGLYVGVDLGGGNLILGWLAVLGGIAAASGVIWVAGKVLPFSRPWYLGTCGAIGAVLGVLSPVIALLIAWFIIGIEFTD